MWKQRAVNLCRCVAMLSPILGCSYAAGGPPQAYAPAAAYPAAPAPDYLWAPQATPAADTGAARIYAAGPGAPAAILVVLPDPGNVMTANPRLWAAQGFDVVTPSPSQLYRIAAGEERAMARLISQAQALADAPIWFVGSNPAIEAAMASLPPAAPGQVSGIVVTSTTTGAGTCSEQMTYSYSGSGAPKVSVHKSGNACPPGSPFSPGIEPNSRLAPKPLPELRPRAPGVIEAAAPASIGSPTAQQAALHQVAEMIKAPPSS